MEQTVIPIKDLAQRWSCTEAYIYKLEGQGVLTRTKLSKVCYPIKQIRDLEMSDEPNPTFKMVKTLKDENKTLSEENRFLRNALRELSQIVYEEDRQWSK